MNIRHIFREYDIRGIYGIELTEQNVKKIAYLLAKRIKKFGLKVAVGYDARVHSPEIASWVISGLNKAGLDIFQMFLVPTPCNYFASFNEDFNASIMITGSHNPPEYNGLKITINKLPFFAKDLQDLADDVENLDIEIPTNTSHKKTNTLEHYIDFLANHFSHLKGMKEKIIADCANGTAGVVLEKLIKKLDLNVTLLYANPDGNFPNHHPDPSIEENLQDVKNALQKDFELGFGFDGDSDRIAVLTKRNNIKGDILALLYAKNIKNPKVLGEVKCSQILYDEVNKIGKSYMYKTGHSNIKLKMKELNIDLATEVSGHIFFADRYFGYDDAIYAMFRVLELVQNGMKLDEEIEKLPKLFSTDEIKIQTTENEKFDIVQKLKKYLQNPPSNFPKIKNIIEVDGVRIEFENGWGLLRASNTTPILVARFEAKTKEDMMFYQTSIEKALQNIKEKI